MKPPRQFTGSQEVNGMEFICSDVNAVSLRVCDVSGVKYTASKSTVDAFKEAAERRISLF